MNLRRLIRIVRHRVRALTQKERLDFEVAEEFAFHLEQLVRENIAAGMTRREAERRARVALGNVAVLEEECRDERRVQWLHDFWQDVRYAFRTLGKNRAFTVVAVLSLALGIGANTAILSALESLFRGALPYTDPDRLVMIRTFPLDNPSVETNATLPDYFAWKDQTRSFETMGASIANQGVIGETGDALDPEHLMGRLISLELFPMLGIQPLFGRVFVESDYRAGQRSTVILISHNLWQRRFGGDPGILNKQIRLNNASFTVVGVMPAYFPYAPERVDYWLPLAAARPKQNTARFFMVTARLKSDVTLEQAQSDMDAVAARLAREFPDRNEGWSARVQPLRTFLFGWTRQPLITLQVAVAFVLLIACANVAGLLLARAAARSPEIAMRIALGAGRGRIVRQLLAESIVLALIGGAIGLFIAQWGLSAIDNITPPPGAPRLPAMGITFPTLALTAVTSIVTGVVCGLIPAFAPFRKHSGSQRVRATIVAAQLAAAFVLLAGAGLMMKSFVLLAGRDLNFDPKGVLLFDFRIPPQEYMRDIGIYRDARYYEVSPDPALTLKRVYERLQQVPGAVSVAGASHPPVNSLILPSTTVMSADTDPATSVYFIVTPNYFATLRTPPLRGRDFHNGDTASTTWVAIVNEAAARRFWPGQDPIGKRFVLDRTPDERYREVIGVVPDIPLRSLQTTAPPVIYLSYLQQPPHAGPFGNMRGQMSFMIRTSGEPLTLVPSVRQAVAEIDPRRPLANIATVEGYIGPRLPDFSRYVVVLTTFAAVATALAAVGVYGMVAYSVAQRTREIAIRVALGASTGEISVLIGRRALVLISIGLVAGLAGSLALARLLASQLWGVTASDPATFIAVSLVLAFAALFACVIPVRRALQVDLTTALRTE